MKIVFVILSAFLLFSSFQPALSFVARPPQFVVFSFDNCTELERWKELSNFLDDMNHSDELVHFTFFVSGTNFLTDANKKIYQGPANQPGDAEINFGGSVQNVTERIKLINKLYKDGNEFASHAVGHFNGSNWTPSDWEKEFQVYDKLITNAATNNNLSYDVKLHYPINKIIGFRAPYLGKNTALYEILKKHLYRYDSSGVNKSDEWPKKINGIWRFNLAKIKIAGSEKYTLSMDYNFMIDTTHDNSHNKCLNCARDKMLDTYTNYFMENYAGNRAPVFIGHHFKNFGNGVYNQALLTFVRKVCHLPEVQCITFSKLADFMDSLSPEMLKAYQNGDFPHTDSFIPIKPKQ